MHNGIQPATCDPSRRSWSSSSSVYSLALSASECVRKLKTGPGQLLQQQHNESSRIDRRVRRTDQGRSRRNTRREKIASCSPTLITDRCLKDVAHVLRQAATRCRFAAQRVSSAHFAVYDPSTSRRSRRSRVQDSTSVVLSY